MTRYPNYGPRDVTTLKVHIARLNWATPRELRRVLMDNASRCKWTWTEDRGFWSSYFVITGEYRYLKMLAETLEGK